MSMLGPMHNELFKYRKRKKSSLDGSTPGVPYERLRRSRRHVSGTPYVPGRPRHHSDLYMEDTPKEYRPNQNAPAVQSEGYETSNDWDSHEISHPTDPRVLRPLPEIPVEQETITYEKLKAAGEVFLKVMEDAYQRLEETQEIPSLADTWEKDITALDAQVERSAELSAEDIAMQFNDIADALGHLQNVFPSDHPDILSLKAAAHEILNNPEKMSKLESLAGEDRPSKLGEGNPYEADMFGEIPAEPEQQIQLPELLQEQFFQIDHVEPEIMPDAVPDESFVQQHNLEDIVAYGESSLSAPEPEFVEDDMMAIPGMDGIDMAEQNQLTMGLESVGAADEINQAIDQIAGQPMPEEIEPDPFQQLYDPLLAQQYMLDPMMQHMPYQTGGPMGPMPM